MIIWTVVQERQRSVAEEEVTITVDIESRADAVAIAAEAEGDLVCALSAQEISSSADGTELLSTDGSGLFSGMTQTDGTAVDSNDQFDGLIIGVSLDADIISQTAVLADLSQIDEGDATVLLSTSLRRS